MALTNRQRVFVEEYLTCWNASEASRRAGYKGKSNVVSARLLANVSIQELVRQRLSEKAMSSDEVLTRLAEHARGDMGDFIDIESMSFRLNLQKAKELGLTRLIKKVKDRVVMTSNKDGEETETHVLEIELYDAKSALDTLAKYHGLIIDRSDVTSGGEKLSIPDERYDRAVSTFADVIRESLSGAVQQPQSPVDAPEQPAMDSPTEQGG